jgi:hypothetical protein
VGGRSNDGAVDRPRDIVRRVASGERLDQPEAEQLGVASGRQQDVVRLQIAMQHPAGVRRLERASDLQRRRPAVSFVIGPATGVPSTYSSTR